MTSISKLTPKLRKAPQPPLSHPGSTADSDRAKRPPIRELSVTQEEVIPGESRRGRERLGKPTGEFGILERANENEDDAVVKWDQDGRTRLHQPSFRKVN